VSPKFAIFCGGRSEERTVSLKTGAAVYESIKKNWDAELFILDQHKVPEGLADSQWIVFPALHGEWGEDGSLQTELEDRSIEYVGSDSTSSALCFDKVAAKMTMDSVGIPTAHGVEWDCSKPKDFSNWINPSIDYVIKPVCQGSSVGLAELKGEDLLKEYSSLKGRWIFEHKIEGFDLTVGLLDGISQGVIGVRPASGFYDYKHKYTPGMTNYEVPAKLKSHFILKVQAFAEKSYNELKCRDFARIDFMISNQGEIYFLEANTLPGMTETSLLPKSASVNGISFDELVIKLVTPSINRLL